MSTKKITESFQGGDLVFGHFDQQDDAMDWLADTETRS